MLPPSGRTADPESHLGSVIVNSPAQIGDFQPDRQTTLDTTNDNDLRSSGEGYHSPSHPVPLKADTYPPGPIRSASPQPSRRRTWGGRSRKATSGPQEPGTPVGVKLQRAMRILVALRKPEVPVGKPPTVLQQLKNIVFGSGASSRSI